MRFHPKSPFATSAVGEHQSLIGVKWLAALLILPALIVAVAQRREHYIRWICIGWMFGVVVSACVAITDYLHITAIGVQLIGFENISGRQSGLSTHPNSLGVACALALPVALMLTERRRVLGPLTGLILLGGAFVSGSRGAQAGCLLALALTFAVLRPSRRAILRFLLAAAMVLSVMTALRPALLKRAAALIRFSSAQVGVAESNQERDLLALQAHLDFQSHPFAGIGLGAITYAHSIYLQLLSAGGLLLFLGFTIYLLGALRSSWHHRKCPNPVSAHLWVSTVTWITMGMVENQLTDRYLYVPIGCIAAIQITATGRGAPTKLRRLGRGTHRPGDASVQDRRHLLR